MAPTTTVPARSAYRWIVLLLCWAAFTVTSVDRAVWGPAALHAGKQLGVAVAGLGTFATAYYLGYVISNAGSGVLADRLGARWVLGGSLALSGLAMIGFGAVHTALFGIAMQAVIGLFAGADYAAGVSLISRWFQDEQRGLAMGVFMTATSLGVVIANAVVPSIVVGAGWRVAYHLFGGISIAVGLLCLVALPRRERRTAETAPARPRLRVLLRHRDLMLLGLVGFGALWGTYGFVTWSNVLMTKGAGISPVRAGAVVAVFGIAALIAKPLVGVATDLFGISYKRVIIVILAFFVVTLLIFGSLRSLTAFFVVSPLLGAAAYAYSPLTAAMFPRLVEPGLVGSAAGAVNAIWQLGSTIVPVVVGAVYAGSGSFFAAFVVLAAGPLLAILVALLLRDSRPADRLTEPDEVAAS
ncbi:MFS transporter [Nocardia alni]|uniref:MFS transporter n=1 Tax=Nocardia alni TaxID=2815723 RepID=UPI001C2256ED|nr:MFS transporter [Nocardia alni]